MPPLWGVYHPARRERQFCGPSSLFRDLSCPGLLYTSRTSEGKLWVPGQRVTLNGGDHVYFLTRRTFNGGRDGTTTTLVLKPDGVWLPDTSKKGKRGKKGKKAFSGSWDFGDET